MYICRMQHNWLQKAGSKIVNPVTGGCYSFFYFLTPVSVKIGDEHVTTKTNAVILHKPGQKRDFYFPQDSRMHWIHGYGSFEELLRQYEIPTGCLLYPEDSGMLSKLFRELSREFNLRRLYREDMTDCRLKELIIFLSRNLQEEKRVANVSLQVRRSISLLRDDMLLSPQKAWSVSQMAEQVFLSPSRFHAAYKALYGTSPMQDVINARVERAKDLLLSAEQETLPMLAEQLGYKSQYHFIEQFKTVTGMTPGAYRRNNR